MLKTSVGLASSLYDTIQVSMTRSSHFLIPVGYRYHARTFIPRQKRPSINIQNNPNNISVYKIVSPTRVLTAIAGHSSLLNFSFGRNYTTRKQQNPGEGVH